MSDSRSNLPITPSKGRKRAADGSSSNPSPPKRRSASPKKLMLEGRFDGAGDAGTPSEETPRPGPRQQKALIRQQEAIENAPRANAMAGDLAEDDESNDGRSLDSDITVPDGFARVLRPLPPAMQIDDNHPLVSIRNVVAAIDRYSRGHYILPVTMKEEIRSDKMANYEFELDYHFDSTAARAALGSLPPLGQLITIVENTQECKFRQVSEAAWNSRVHDELLDSARKLSTHANHLYIANVTSARLSKDLVPSWRSDRARESKVVDFAVTLTRPFSERHLSIPHAGYARITLQAGEKHRTWNQTPYEPIRNEPIAISFETKPTAADSKKARVQLATWAAAQYAKLEQLIECSGRGAGAMVKLPVLLLGVAEGANWIFIPVSKDATTGELTLWEGEIFGSTDRLLGACKAFTVLQLLYCCAEETYRPWFEENIVPLTAAERARLLSRGH